MEHLEGGEQGYPNEERGSQVPFYHPYPWQQTCLSDLRLQFLGPLSGWSRPYQILLHKEATLRQDHIETLPYPYCKFCLSLFLILAIAKGNPFPYLFHSFWKTNKGRKEKLQLTEKVLR